MTKLTRIKTTISRAGDQDKPMVTTIWRLTDRTTLPLVLRTEVDTTPSVGSPSFFTVQAGLRSTRSTLQSWIARLTPSTSWTGCPLRSLADGAGVGGFVGRVVSTV